jgi:hypothetical protein
MDVNNAVAVAQYFSNNAQIREYFDASSSVLHEYVSPSTTHGETVGSMLLDPDCRQTNSQLRCITLLLNKSTAIAEAAKVHDPLQAHKLRHATKTTCRLSIQNAVPNTDEESTVSATSFSASSTTEHATSTISVDNSSSNSDLVEKERDTSKVDILLSVYTVPLGYRLVGIAQQTTASQERLFVVRVVLETHHLASVEGTIRLHNGVMNDFDSSLVTAIRTYENKVSERQGDPLPIASALASIVLSQQPRDQSVQDAIKLLLLSDQVLVKIECCDRGEREMTREEQMMAVLQHSLQRMGLTSSSDDADGMPALVKDH